MRTVPSVGGGKGIFELFVPGAFLLLNLGLAAFFMDPAIKTTDDPLVKVLTSPVVTAIVFISFGYLLGVVLRIVRVGYADRVSTDVISSWRWIRGKKPARPVYLREGFPFIESLGIRCHRDYPAEVGDYYDKVWADLDDADPDDKRQWQAFFNFCKAILASEDEAAYREASAAESLSRYIASICYALAVSVFILLGVAAYRQWWISASPMAPIALLFVYLIGILFILRNYRLIRLKEAETVFALIFKHRLFSPKEEPENVEREEVGA